MDRRSPGRLQTQPARVAVGRPRSVGGFAGWAYLVSRAVERRTVAAFAAAGAGVALLALTRPANQALLVVTPLLLTVPGSWRVRLTRAATFAATALVLLGAWAVYNDVRYGDFTVARGGQASVPLFRAFVTDRIMAPDNGPASRRLAAAVRDHLLPLEPYRSYGITLQEFFESGQPAHGGGSRRAVRPRLRLGHELLSSGAGGPGGSSPAVRDLRPRRRQVALAGTRTAVVRSRPAAAARAAGCSGDEGPGVTSETIVVGGRVLPRPSEGQPIPAAHQSDYVSTPDGSIRDLWRSAVDHGIVFPTPREQSRYERMEGRAGELLARFPRRRDSGWLRLQLNHASKVYPRP